MRKISMFVLVMFALFSTASAVPAEDVKDKFQGLYDTLARAMTQHNADGVLAILADNFVTVNKNGEAKTHDASVAEMKDNIQAIKSGTMKFTVLEVKEADGGGVLVRNRLESDVIVTLGKDDHHIVSDEISDDTWILAGDTVKLQKSATVSRKGTVDDKPVED